VTEPESCICSDLVEVVVRNGPIAHFQDVVYNGGLFWLKELTDRTVMEHVGWIGTWEGATRHGCCLGLSVVHIRVSSLRFC